ncbi:RDD family protein [candidate division KSB1 bacterium]
MENNYPNIVKRYIAALIDGLLVLALLFISAYILRPVIEFSKTGWIIIALFLLLVYEPLFTSKLCTLGQKIIGIRVRRFMDKRRISLFQAYKRYAVKLIFGLISLFTVPVTEGNRAIHDFAADTIVYNADEVNE